MFSVLHETDDSTGINLCAYGNFIPGSGSQLLTVGRKYLRLFRTNPYALVVQENDGFQEFAQKTRLECMFSIRLLSAVQDVAVAKIPMFPFADVMILAFDDAKLSVVGISPTDRSLTTLSLHSFEDDTLKEGYMRNCVPPIVRSDPSSRCAAMLVYGRHMAVIPFNEGASHISSYTVKLSSIDPRLENVLDMTFLEGYFEPTLLFLYEPLQTTAGRASIRSDTCCIMGVSINAREKQQAVVWQMSGLPMDCYRMHSIPSPLGGVLVVGANEIIYLNQSVPACGVSLNSCSNAFTKFPLKDRKELSMVLDASESAVLSPSKIALCTREGQMLLVDLETDSSSNAVKSVDVSLVYDVTIVATMVRCAEGHLFIGSRLGDSQLLQYNIKKEEVALEDGPTAAKKSYLEEMDDDDRLLYGEEEEKETEVKSTRTVEIWEWNELDRLPSIGPVLSVTAGKPKELSSEFEGKDDPVFDLVTASGRDKQGSLCIMQRSIRPNLISSSVIEGALQLWAVGVREDGSHRYLIIARERSTIVLELEDEMIEIEQPIFIVDEQTITAGELADGAIAVQVTTQSICLVGGEAEQLQCLEVESNFPVMAASIIDPYVSILTENGKVLIYQLVTQPSVHLKELDLSTTQLGLGNVTAMSVYKDLSGLMIRESIGGGRKKRREERMKRDQPKVSKKETKEEEEDLEDLLLYGESKRTKKREDDHSSSIFSRKRRRVMVAASAIGGEESDALDPNTNVPTHWIVVAKRDGKMAIYELPNMSLVYQVHRFGLTPQVLCDTTAIDDEKERKEMNAPSKTGNDELDTTVRVEERVVELNLTGMGINQSRPVLFAVLDDTLIAYEIFPADNENDGHLAIRFRRLPLTLPIRSTPFIGVEGKRSNIECASDETLGGSFVIPFERVGPVMHGVFIRGPTPGIAILSAINGFAFHPISIDGPIRSFTPFNNENAPSGFLYVTESNEMMRVASLQPDFNYETSILLKKIPIEKTVHFVRFCMQRGVYVVVSSRPIRSNRICTLSNEEKQLETLPRADSFVCPAIDEYAVDLYSDEDWKAVPNTGITLEEMEVVTGCEEVLLRSESTMSGLQNYVVIGTINNYGEEVLIRGRLILIELIEVVPEPGQPTSKHKMKVLYDKEQKGPLTSLCASDGFLITGMGQKIFIWQYKDNDLQGIAFIDLHYYIHSVTAIRSLTLACDVFASMSVVRFQEKFKALSVASRDCRRNAPPPLTSSFIIDNDHLGFVLSDEEGNICIFNYLPREGFTADELSLRGSVNIGTAVNAMMRIKGHTSSLPISPLIDKKEAENQHTTLWASLDGSMGYVRSLGEKQFRRLHCLQQSMATVVPQACGLNPRGARSIRPPRPSVVGESTRNVVDVDIVGQFMHLSVGDKQELARKLGGNRYQMMDDLIMLQRLSTHF
ncbi:hypothetical protein PFISCL1PPCAC_14837 [Pristionchus fissidentatus]|uniref:Uncharacterized protein n=1 Tax=Pristionchus fissidentatus TaxID=1538716 RepID=A0AAV5VVJ2_9BILA|nr:hypothetical protein PFISCL1PPCAC_14837 [Pristionchus fissidentatus]